MDDGPTRELYGAIERVYKHFNSTLFDGELPPVLLTTQRQKNVMGYFSLERWVSVKGKRCHEIAINPAYVGRAALIEVFQTIVHEQAHCWQHCYGTPSRRSYHNKEWANKMESIGLMPSTTGRPGGAKTGEKMNDYPIKDGKFILECQSLLKGGFELPWVDRHAAPSEPSMLSLVSSELKDLGHELEEEIHAQLSSSLDQVVGQDNLAQASYGSSKTKTKYSCEGCNLNVWGKPGLSIACEACDTSLVER